jgi:hypothetical protein
MESNNTLKHRKSFFKKDNISVKFPKEYGFYHMPTKGYYAQEIQ